MFRLLSTHLLVLLATLLVLLATLLVLSATPAFAKQPGYYGYGSPASVEEIAGWDIDVRPDGVGLPPGSGTVEDGEWIYEDQCAECHGSFGEGMNAYPSLAGGEDTLTDNRPHKTVGSFWPHTSTLWDYIHRAMPFAQPESLTDDEVYAVTAYVLYLNDLVDDDFELTQANLASIELPNKPNFKPDDRPDTQNTRCMSNCKDPATIEITSIVDAPTKAVLEAEATAALQSTPPSAGKTVYDQACGMCHNMGLAGAPMPGDKTSWAPRIAQGMATIYKHAIEGFQGEAGVMAPKGGFTHLSDDEVKAAVLFMVEQSQ